MAPVRGHDFAAFNETRQLVLTSYYRMFNQQELQILLGGVDTPIDLEDLRQHTNYGGLYDDHEPTIQLFWKVVNTFDQEQRRKLLRFATSCSRPPLLCVPFVFNRSSARGAYVSMTRL